MKILNYIHYLFIKFFLKRFYPPFKIKSNSLLQAGKMSYHNGNFSVSGDQKVFIGKYCAFGKNVSIITSNHDYNYPSIQGTFYSVFFRSAHPGVLKNPPNKERTKGNIIIGNDVWISHNVSILSGVTIGNGVCIANNSIVTKDIEAYSVVAGIPAKVIKKRYDIDKIKYLQEIKWWDWDEDKIVRNKDFFFVDLNKISLTEIINKVQ
jgi:acetyltransferase-like isoleucine patch superfamily enzyme